MVDYTGGVLLSSSSHWQFDLKGEIKSYNDYKDLIKCLHESSENDTVTIRINSSGGLVDVGIMIVKAMQSSSARVLCEIIYPSQSMAAVIALCGDSLNLQKHTFLMFHTYTTGTYGKSDEILQDVVHNERHTKAMFTDIVRPFLTKCETDKMFDGKDIYIHWDDEDLELRKKRQFRRRN
jgi:ATP-dependent protease ClpP protease subunit